MRNKKSPLGRYFVKRTFQIHSPDFPDHIQDPLEPSVLSLQTPPSSTHAKSCAAIGLRFLRSLNDWVELDQRGSFCGCTLVVSGLRTVGTIF
jgi:hypothetical protein